MYRDRQTPCSGARSLARDPKTRLSFARQTVPGSAAEDRQTRC